MDTEEPSTCQSAGGSSSSLPSDRDDAAWDPLAHAGPPLLPCCEQADQTAGGRERTASRPSSSDEGFEEERIEPHGSGRSIGAMGEGADGAPSDDLESLNLTDEERVVLAKVGAILRRLSFGTVVLVVQDGKVVQIEMAEKFRLR
jgi:hypothetical protein